MEIENYAASSSIGDMKEQDLADIEADFQHLADHYATRVTVDDYNEIYGPFQNNPERFKLLSGEKKTMMAIAKAVSQHGIEKFLDGVFEKPNARLNESVDVVAKIKAYYAERYVAETICISSIKISPFF